MFRVGYLAALAIAFAIPSDPSLADPDQWRAEWPDTEFSRTTIDFAEVISGGPPKDGIPALDGATITPVAAETWLDDRETVMTYAHPGELRGPATDGRASLARLRIGRTLGQLKCCVWFDSLPTCSLPTDHHRHLARPDHCGFDQAMISVRMRD